MDVPLNNINNINDINTYEELNETNMAVAPRVETRHLAYELAETM